MSVVRLKIGYTFYAEEPAKVSQEQWELLGHVFNFDTTQEKRNIPHDKTEVVVNIDDVPQELFDIDCNIQVKPIKRLLPKPTENLTRLANNDITALKELLSATVQVHFPGELLLRINEVTWLDDGCTERLQEHLTDGWRIIAICPSVGEQRRPDYILGRVNRTI